MQSPTTPSGTFREQLLQAGELPVLPEVHLKAMRLATDPEGSASKLQEVLRHDPTLAAKILKVANSAYYGFRQRIESLQTAMVMLGMDEVMRMIATTSVLTTFDRERLAESFDPLAFWYHSAAVGRVCEQITSRLYLQPATSPFTAGLLHEIGEILLAHNFPVQYEVCVEYAEKHNVPLPLAQARVLGLDQAEIGALLAGHWNLPDPLIAMIRSQGKPEVETTFPLEAALLHISDRIASRHGRRASDSGDDVPLESDPAWELLDAGRWPDSVDRSSLISDMAQVVGDAEDFVQTMVA